ncbi:GntR family transcriptional regulator [Dactylosporangium sp. CA-139114]|uniref:GntR family transcriptional regulator n=1 Tax=Dactylosporangium sp. CA-139114 TaxID=3239931 RepID=UPI003D980D47
MIDAPSGPVKSGKWRVVHPEPSKHELAYREIRARIIDGRLGPGRRLVLSALARELDVSPVPVREAIRRLEAEGLVAFERNVGARVATLQDDEWEELVEMLALLDGFAFAAAAARVSPEDLAEARAFNGRLREAAAAGPIDHGQVMALHRRFHRALYRCCGNRYVIESLDAIWDRIDASRVLVTLYPALRVAAAVEEHDELLERLERGEDDPALLESCAREHNLNAIRTIRKNVS